MLSRPLVRFPRRPPPSQTASLTPTPCFPCASGSTSLPAGFTLVELLVVISIIAILSGLGFVGSKAAMLNARKSREIGAAKALTSAYLSYAAENDGFLMVAHYEGSGGGSSNSNYELPNGERVTGPALHRYPFRLAPYLNNQIDGTLLVNKNKDQIAAKFSGNDFYYGVSLCPALGINHYYVGGYAVDGQIANSGECATQLSQAHGKLLVFASAFTTMGDQKIDGHFSVTPPKYRTDLWSGGSSPDVDFRYNGKAVAAFMDGSVDLLANNELTDMRLWSKGAEASDDPNYNIAPAASGGLGGTGGGRR